MKRHHSAAVAAVVLLAVAAAASALAGDPPAACGRGVPAFKCAPGGAVAAAGNRPRAVSAPIPYWPSPGVVACGRAFFRDPVVARVSERFGSLRCFRFAKGDRWILFADGMQAAGDGPAPGGAVVAVAACAGPGRAHCLDPDAVHDFADFVVARPPDPRAWPVRLQTSFGDRLLSVADGPCGVVAFDLLSLRWLGGTTKTVDAAMRGGAPPALAAPPPEPGASALAGSAPAAPGKCRS